MKFWEFVAKALSIKQNTVSSVTIINCFSDEK